MKTSEKKFLTFGVVNLTPDSFSDGGVYAKPDQALVRARKLLDDGADYIDVGAESTRPGAAAIGLEEEWRRLSPFLNLAKVEGILPLISIDTRNFETMARAVEIGVSFINCVGAIPTEQELGGLIAINPELGFIATHMHGTPATMQASPLGALAAKKRVTSYFENSFEELTVAGFLRDRVFLDPGIGFGKSDEANLNLLAEIPFWRTAYNVAVGVSRKGFLGRLFGAESQRERDQLSKSVETFAVLGGAKLVRTHDVHGLRRISSTIEGAIW